MNQPVPSITCDTPGCDTTLAAFDFELLSYRAGIAVAAEQGWRHGPDRLRRCPACVTKGWPGCMPRNGELPDPALYNDLAVLYAWCDATYGPLRAATG